MDIYIEYVILDNCVIDYSIIRLIEMSCGIKIRKVNKFVICILGTISAIILPYFYTNNLALIVYRIATSIVLVLCIKKYKKFKNFATYYCLFMAYTFLIGGACLGLINLLGIEYNASSIIMYSFEFPLGLFGLIFIVFLKVVFYIIRVIKNKLKVANYLYDISLENNRERVDCVGFFDSGNNIKSENRGVNVISVGLFLKLFRDIDLQKLLLNSDELTELRNKKYISISGIGGDEKYLSFEIDSLKINGKIFTSPRLAVAMKNFGEYECILHKDFIEG